VDEVLRNEAVDAIVKVLAQDEQSRGVISWAKDQLTGFGLRFGTNVIQRKRGALTDGAYPFAGDILLYQAKGQKIRDFIRSQVEQVDSPVVLLAHSLGGIACVDLLIEQDLRDKVKQLITVGSQAPFLYEIDALQSLSFGESLPEHFPKWLNIYDLRDFLSYVGDREGLFPGRLKDVVVDNKQPFPEAHGAYWANTDTWRAITEVLP
jgi:pimeloyl-ACP methyl ester carboxylesterase